MLNHYRDIKRKHFDHHDVDEFVKKASLREKRSSESHMEFIENIISNSESREKRKRDNRDYSEIDRAYSKYYEQIKARYRDYVKSLFSNHRQRVYNNSHLSTHDNGEERKNSRKLPIQDGRWQNSQEFKYRVQQKARTLQNDLQNENDDDDSYVRQPVAIPTINDRINHRYDAINATISNYYPTYVIERIPDEIQETTKKPTSQSDIAANVYAQLQSQIVRRKRENDEDGKEDENVALGGKKKDKTRGPCEPLIEVEHMQVEIVKPPKIPSESFGHGIVLKVTCDSGYNSNVQTANSTVRCNKGVWKPVRPFCTLSKFLLINSIIYN